MRLSAEVFAAAEQRQNPVGERELVLRGLSIPAIEHLQITRDAFDAIDFTDNRIVRLDNFPRMLRLSNLMLSGNVVESIDPANLRKNVPNVKALILSHNRVSTLHEVANIGEACPKLEFLCLRDNPVTRRQHYRLYAINHIPSLKVLDMIRISRTERDRAERLSKSAAGAALEKDVSLEAREATKTFVPGEGESAGESFTTNFTAEQKKQIREMIANAKSPAEIEEIESSVQRGVFPQHLAEQQGSVTPPNITDDNKAAGNNGAARKRAVEDDAEDEVPRKRTRTRSSSRTK